MLLHKDAVISGFAGGSGKGGGQYDKLGLYVCMYIYMYIYQYPCMDFGGLPWDGVG